MKQVIFILISVNPKPLTTSIAYRPHIWKQHRSNIGEMYHNINNKHLIHKMICIYKYKAINIWQQLFNFYYTDVSLYSANNFLISGNSVYYHKIIMYNDGLVYVCRRKKFINRQMYTLYYFNLTSGSKDLIWFILANSDQVFLILITGND